MGASSTAIVLGYVAYVFITAFGFLQLFDMVRGQNRDLGRLPLFSLILGLALLQSQLTRDGAPLYLVIGNGASLTATVLNMAWTVLVEKLSSVDADARIYTLTEKGYAETDRIRLERRFDMRPATGEAWRKQ